MKKVLFLLCLLISYVTFTAPHDDEVELHKLLENFFNIVLNSMNFVAAKGNQKAQLSAGSQILNSVYNICLLASRRLPTEDLLALEVYRHQVITILKKQHATKLLSKNSFFISGWKEHEEIVQPS